MTASHLNGHPTPDTLLAGLDAAPVAADRLNALALYYLDAATTDTDRTALRAAITARPALCAAIERFYRQDTPERDPLRYFVTSLALIAITDGQPDPRRAGAALRDLARFARQHGITPGPYFAEVESIAGPTAARLFRLAQRPLWRRLALANLLLAALLVLGGLLIEAALDDPLRAVGLIVLLAAVFSGQLYIFLRHV